MQGSQSSEGPSRREVGQICEADISPYTKISNTIIYYSSRCLTGILKRAFIKNTFGSDTTRFGIDYKFHNCFCADQVNSQYVAHMLFVIFLAVLPKLRQGQMTVSKHNRVWVMG